MRIKSLDKAKFTHIGLAGLLFLLASFYSVPPQSTDLLGLGVTWIVNRQCQRSPDKHLKICSFDVFQSSDQKAIAVFYDSTVIPHAVNIRFGEVSLKAQFKKSLIAKNFFVITNTPLIGKQFSHSVVYPNLPTRDFRFTIEPEFSLGQDFAQKYTVKVF